MSCAFCRLPSASGTYHRHAALDVCPSCVTGEVLPLLELRGYTARSVSRTELHLYEGGGLMHILEVDITLPVDPGVRLQCVREEWHHRFERWFRHELQVGDPTFDRAVWVDEGSGMAAADLLKNEGIQAAILLVVHSGTFLLHGSQLRAHTMTRTPLPEEDRRELVLEVAAAALHIVDWTTRR